MNVKDISMWIEHFGENILGRRIIDSDEILIEPTKSICALLAEMRAFNILSQDEYSYMKEKYDFGPANLRTTLNNKIYRDYLAELIEELRNISESNCSK